MIFLFRNMKTKQLNYLYTSRCTVYSNSRFMTQVPTACCLNHTYTTPPLRVMITKTVIFKTNIFQQNQTKINNKKQKQKNTRKHKRKKKISQRNKNKKKQKKRAKTKKINLTGCHNLKSWQHLKIGYDFPNLKTKKKQQKSSAFLFLPERYSTKPNRFTQRSRILLVILPTSSVSPTLRETIHPHRCPRRTSGVWPGGRLLGEIFWVPLGGKINDCW